MEENKISPICTTALPNLHEHKVSKVILEILTKDLQFHSNLADILAILSTHELIILTKFDEDRTKIVDFLLALYFWSSIIFFNQGLGELTYITDWDQL